MSQKKIKQYKRKLRQYQDDMKKEALTQFLNFAKDQGIRKRIKFALKIIFKRV